MKYSPITRAWVVIYRSSASELYLDTITAAHGTVYAIVNQHSLIKVSANTGVATPMSAPSVAGSTLSNLMTDSSGHVYVITTTGTQYSNRDYEVWQYNSQSDSWYNTGFYSKTGGSLLYKLIADSHGYLYASTQNGTYVLNGTLASGGWKRIDSAPALYSIINKQNIISLLTRNNGIYQATPSS